MLINFLLVLAVLRAEQTHMYMFQIMCTVIQFLKVWLQGENTKITCVNTSYLTFKMNIACKSDLTKLN